MQMQRLILKGGFTDMSAGRKITDLAETTSVTRESAYMVAMGDGTGSKHIKHKNLVEQLKKEIVPEGSANIEEMTYDETMDFLNGTSEEALS